MKIYLPKVLIDEYSKILNSEYTIIPLTKYNYKEAIKAGCELVALSSFTKHVKEEFKHAKLMNPYRITIIDSSARGKKHYSTYKILKRRHKDLFDTSKGKTKVSNPFRDIEFRLEETVLKSDEPITHKYLWTVSDAILRHFKSNRETRGWLKANSMLLDKHILKKFLKDLGYSNASVTQFNKKIEDFVQNKTFVTEHGDGWFELRSVKSFLKDSDANLMISSSWVPKKSWTFKEGDFKNIALQFLYGIPQATWIISEKIRPENVEIVSQEKVGKWLGISQPQVSKKTRDLLKVYSYSVITQHEAEGLFFEGRGSQVMVVDTSFLEKFDDTTGEFSNVEKVYLKLNGTKLLNNMNFFCYVKDQKSGKIKKERRIVKSKEVNSRLDSPKISRSIKFKGVRRESSMESVYDGAIVPVSAEFRKTSQTNSRTIYSSVSRNLNIAKKKISSRVLLDVYNKEVLNGRVNDLFTTNELTLIYRTVSYQTNVVKSGKQDWLVKHLNKQFYGLKARINDDLEMYKKYRKDKKQFKHETKKSVSKTTYTESCQVNLKSKS